MRIVVHDYAGHPFQFDLSRELARRGHDVAHLYFSGDKGPKGRSEMAADDPPTLTIVPVEIGRAYSKSALVGRLRDDLEYGRAAGRQIGAFKPDVVISGNTPLDAQRRVIGATHKAGAAFVFWMQDFYSRAIRSLIGRKWGGVGGAVAAYYEMAERAQLKASDAVVLISPDFQPAVEAFGVEPERVRVIPNWGALDSLPLRPKDNAWSRAHGLDETFVFLYSGTLGLKHNPDHLLAIADRFSGDPAVRVVVAAHGQGRDRLERSLLARPRSNLRLLDLQPLEILPDMLGAADVVVALLENDAGEFSLPSKVLSYYCSGRALLLSAPSKNLASRTTCRIGAGLTAAPEDVGAMLEAASRLRGDDATRAAMGTSARAYAEATFPIEPVADRFQEAFTLARSLQRRSA